MNYDKTISRALIDILCFLEFCNDDQVDPDLAVSQLEQAAATLRTGGDSSTRIFCVACEEYAEELAAQHEERSDFVRSLPDTLGLLQPGAMPTRTWAWHPGTSNRKPEMQNRILILVTMLILLIGCNRPAPDESASGLEEVTSASVDYDAMVFEMRVDAAVYALRGDLDRAKALIDKAIQIAPKDAELYATRGVLYRKQGNYELALEDLNRAIRLRPDFADAFCERGFVYQQSDLDADRERAIADADKAIQLDPTISLAYLVRGGALVEQGDVEGGIRDYTKTLELNPKSSVAYRKRAIAHVLTGEFEKAQSDIDTAYSLYLTPSDRETLEQVQEKLNQSRNYVVAPSAGKTQTIEP